MDLAHSKRAVHGRAAIFKQNGPQLSFFTFLSQTLELNSMMEVRFKNVFRAVASGNFPRAKEIIEPLKPI